MINLKPMKSDKFDALEAMSAASKHEASKNKEDARGLARFVESMKQDMQWNG